MPTNPPMPTVLILGSIAARTAELRMMLELANYQVQILALNLNGREVIDDHVDLVVLDAATNEGPRLLDLCRRLRSMETSRFRPIVVITDDDSGVFRALSHDVGADGHLVRPFDPIELLRQVKAFLRIKLLQDELFAKSVELGRLNSRLQLVCDQIEQELRFARKIQESFLPATFPGSEVVRFAARCAMSGQVSGDCYDVFRLVGESFAFYVADVMGHGVPAGLLTIYVKKGLIPSETTAEGLRPLPPGEVLSRLNDDLVRQSLQDSPFITMVYFTIDSQTLRLDYSRAGHPLPILLRGRKVTPLPCDGPLLGILETTYPTETIYLEPGDRLVTMTDGIDGVRFGAHAEGMPAFIACLKEFAHLPIRELLEAIYRTLFPDGRHDDDLTLLIMEISPDATPTVSTLPFPKPS